MNNIDTLLKKRLWKEATKYPNRYNKYLVAASLHLKDGRKVFGANNTRKTHPISAQVPTSLRKSDYTHAEVRALANARNLLRGDWLGLIGATILVVRFLRSGYQDTAIAKPCKQCEWILRRYGIHSVIYTTRNGQLATDIYR